MTKSLHRNSSVVLAAAAFCLASGAAHAASVTYSGSYNGATDVTNYAINVQQFNPLLGTLTGVTVSLSGTMSSTVSATNDGSFRVGVDLMDYGFSLDGTGISSGVQISDSQGPVRVIGTGTADGTFALAELQTVTCPGTGCTGTAGNYVWTTTATTLTESQVFTPAPGAQYIGTGSLQYFLTTLTEVALSVGGLQTGGLPSPAPFGMSTNMLGTVDITYEYSPVPLPAAAWLLISGLAGLGFLRKRKAA